MWGVREKESAEGAGCASEQNRKEGRAPRNIDLSTFHRLTGE
jgi:hypothetical protein